MKGTNDRGVVARLKFQKPVSTPPTRVRLMFWKSAVYEPVAGRTFEPDSLIAKALSAVQEPCPPEEVDFGVCI